MGKFRALERAQLTKDWLLEEITALAHFLTERKVVEGDPIFLKQSKDRGLYFIETGIVRIQYEGLSVDLREGDSFGELSLFDENQKPVSTTAAQSCSLWVLTMDNLMEMKATTPSVAVKLMESICGKIAKSLSVFTVPTRIITGSAAGSPSGLSKQTGGQPRPNLL